ncbi:MAG: PfkB family carbohydrate kinase [Candidatus Andersenbacteria bacterium]
MKPPRVQEIISRFTGQKILVIGDVVLDRYIFGKVERLNPEAPVPILHAKQERQATGAAGNTAKNAAMLGAQVTLLSVVGDDDTAEAIKQAARTEGYMARLIYDTTRPSIEKIRYYVGSQQMLRVDYEETHDITDAVEADVLKAIKELAVQVHGMVVSDYAKGVVTESVAAATRAVIEGHALQLMVDVKPSRINSFSGATYISPNRKEAHEYLGLNQHDHGGYAKEKLAEMLQEKFSTTVFLTLSEEGMYVRGTEGTGTHVPQAYVGSDEVIDPSGCGDTAAVTILLAKLAGATDVEAAELGNAAAAVVLNKIGSVGLTQAELLQKITIPTHH